MKLLPTWAAERLDLLPDEHTGAGDDDETVAFLTALHPPVDLDQRPATAYARAVARIPAPVVNARSRARRWLGITPAPRTEES